MIVVVVVVVVVVAVVVVFVVIFDDDDVILFSHPQVKTVSNACYGLCCWVHAIISYDRVAKVVAPKKQALAVAEAEVAGLMAILDQKRVSEKLDRREGRHCTGPEKDRY